MATQLILYPQTFNGELNPISISANEFIVDGNNFNTLNTSVTNENNVVSTNFILTTYPPTIPNSWYRYRLNPPAAAYPTATNGNMILSTSGAFSASFAYQKITNLTVGQSYTIYVNPLTSATGTLGAQAYDGSTSVSSNSIVNPTSSDILTTTFVASNTSMTIITRFFATATTSIEIGYVSVLPDGQTPNISLSNGQVICDLYEDETIPLTLSVDDFKNAAEQVQSYSKAFDLPATKRNNQIFENLFEVTRSAQNSITFNPYAKTRCELKQDGFILFEGYLRVLDIQDKEGEISYNVNLYSEVIAFADFLGDRTFSDLDFSELSHNYNFNAIRNSWQGNLPLLSPLSVSSYAYSATLGVNNTSVLRYPFVNWENSYTLNPSTNFPVLPNLESSFRPFINIKYIIQNIFAATNNFTYTSDFIDNDTDFGKLFMDFNWGADNTPADVNAQQYNGYYMPLQADGSALNYANTTFTTLALSYNIPFGQGQTPPNYDDVTNIITSTNVNETYSINYQYNINNTDTVPRTIECQWLYNSTPINNTGTITLAAGAVYDFSGTFNKVMTTVGDTLQAQFKASSAGVVNQTALLTGQLYSSAQVVFNVSATAITSNTILQTLRGELGQWEFIKGIMTMFNLVSMPDPVNPNNIIIEPYKEIFQPSTDTANPNFFDDNSEELDWTDKIDISQIKLTPLTDLNKKTIFKFVEDDDDYTFNVYKNSTEGHLYGSAVYDATLQAGGMQSVLDGEKEVVAEPFAATVPRPLSAAFTDFIVPAIYSHNTGDNVSEGFDNSPRIMFNNGFKTLTSCTYFVPDQNGGSGDAFEDDFLQFTHLSNIPTVATTRDFHFGECQLVQPIGAAPVDNLFQTYWLPYLAELYNPDTRTMTLKVNLSAGDINTFKFYDTVFIKNRKFRVNRIDYNPNELATVEFILIP